MLLSKTNPINASQNKSEKSFHKMVNDISKNSLLPQQCKGPQSPKNQPAKTDEQAKLRKQTEVLKKN